VDIIGTVSLVAFLRLIDLTDKLTASSCLIALTSKSESSPSFLVQKVHMHCVEGVRRLGRLATGFDLLDPTVLAISSSAAVATRICQIVTATT
jgi:hypothetical protein